MSPALAIRISTTSSWRKSSRTSPLARAVDQPGDPLKRAPAEPLELRHAGHGRREQVGQGTVGGLQSAQEGQVVSERHPGIGLLERPHRCVDDLLHGVDEDRCDQLAPVGEVAVEGRVADVGPAGDLIERRVEAALGEDQACGLDPPASVAAAVPDGVTAEQAAAVGLAAVMANDLLDALSLGTDDVVLVAGATGGVGAYAVQLVAATGATVAATARPGDQTEFVRRLGAADVADHTGDLEPAVREVAPEGVTAVVHAAGDATALAACRRPAGLRAGRLR